jgi:hypothetical protein
MVSVERSQDQLIRVLRVVACRSRWVMIKSQMEAQGQRACSGCHPEDKQHQNEQSLTNRARHRGIVTDWVRSVNTAGGDSINLTIGFPVFNNQQPIWS